MKPTSKPAEWLDLGTSSSGHYPSWVSYPESYSMTSSGVPQKERLLRIAADEFCHFKSDVMVPINKVEQAIFGTLGGGVIMRVHPEMSQLTDRYSARIWWEFDDGAVDVCVSHYTTVSASVPTPNYLTGAKPRGLVVEYVTLMESWAPMSPAISRGTVVVCSFDLWSGEHVADAHVDRMVAAISNRIATDRTFHLAQQAKALF